METSIDKKFYVPSIEEFHVGFEYEEYTNYDGVPKYRSCIYGTEGNSWDFKSMAFRLERHDFRVKCLDKEDIESLGWVFDRTQFDILEIFEFNRTTIDSIASKFILTLNTKEKFLVIEYKEEYLYTPIAEDFTIYKIFTGKIKNKSELKKLMQQLNII